MTEQEFLDAINSAKAFGYAEGMKASKPRELSDEALKLAEERANNPYLDPEANAQDFRKIAEILKKASEK